MLLFRSDSSKVYGNSCFIKYTGYGNAVGLQLSYGLFGGGKSDGATDYSSDSDSDTEEYVPSKPR